MTNGHASAVVIGLSYYFLTTLPVVLAVFFGHWFLRPFLPPAPDRAGILQAFAANNGRSYAGIVDSGYAYTPGEQSNVAFFPAFPAVAAAIRKLTDLPAVTALLLVSHGCLAAAFVVLYRYVQSRFRDSPPEFAEIVLLTFGTFPTGFFLRMAYSESLFLLLVLYVLYGIERHWPVAGVALVAGLATAARPVGAALLGPLVLYVWRSRKPTRRRIAELLWSLPLGCWGLIAYCAFLSVRFGEPFAFAKAQGEWWVRPEATVPRKLFSLCTLEPLWAVFDTASPTFWAARDRHGAALFSLHAANPLIFVAALLLLAFGCRRRWLSAYEAILAAGLFGIPYLTRAFEMGMAGFGRFTAVVFPLYLVLALIHTQLPRPASAAVHVLAGAYLAFYSALFGAGYLLI
ncbi:MAG TPA: hypothetical protein VND64_35535 [Pirellulales bacterium]|nr:hypothetical protein [Pirellulales bacterium]